MHLLDMGPPANAGSNDLGEVLAARGDINGSNCLVPWIQVVPCRGLERRGWRGENLGWGRDRGKGGVEGGGNGE